MSSILPCYTEGARCKGERSSHRVDAIFVEGHSAFDSGITMMNPSPDFGAQAAEVASLELSRRYMDASAYFRLKNFSYYPRGYSRKDFDEDLRNSDPTRLPFRMSA